jgi:hypothetical protein
MEGVLIGGTAMVIFGLVFLYLDWRSRKQRHP